MHDLNFISVVIPNLHSPVIDQVLAALKSQSWIPRAFEILVVGLDKHNLVKEDDTVRLVSTGEPVNPARARNIGWRLARYDTVFFLDADCIPRVDWLLEMVKFVRAHEDAGAVLSGMDLYARNYWALCDQIAVFHEHLSFQPSGTRPSLPSYGLYVPKVVLQQVNGFDEGFPFPAAEDLDLTIRIGQSSHRLFFNASAVVIHCPSRGTLKDLWQHSYQAGYESIKVRLRYAGLYRMPSWSHLPWAWRVLALPIALIKTSQILCDRHVWKYAHCAPFIVLAKMAWCLGASEGISANPPTR